MNMKKQLLVLFFVSFSLLVSSQTTKDQERFNYVAKQMKLNPETKNKLRPLFYSYRKDLRAAKSTYNTLKDKNITAIKRMKLTAEQAKALNNARWNSDIKATEVKKAYTQKFSTILTPQQVYYLFSYANDSKEKRERK